MTNGHMPFRFVRIATGDGHAHHHRQLLAGAGPQILCEAYRLRMFGADYAWILHESMGAPWWPDQRTACSNHELQLAVENLIVVSTHNSIVGNNVSYSGLVS